MKKSMKAICIFGAMLIALSGCGTKAEIEEKKEVKSEAEVKTEQVVEVEFWHAMGGEKGEALQKLTDDFNAKNEDIEVKLVHQGGYRDLFSKLMASAKAKALPTMTQIYCNRLSWYVDKGLVEDLSPYMKDSKIGLSDQELEDIPPLFLDDGIWNDRQYAFPFNKSQMVLYYNQDMLDKAGVEVPKTWEEWSEANKKLTIDENGDGEPEIYGTVFANNISTDIAPWVKQAGGVIIDEEKDQLNFDSEATKEAVSFIAGMIEAKIARTAGEDKHSNVPFSQKRAAMCVASTSAIPYIQKGVPEDMNWFAAPLPANKTNDQLYYGTNVAVFNTVDSEKREAAWKYVKYLTLPENTAYFSMNTGYLPVRYSARELPEYKSYIEKNPIKGVGLVSFDNGFQGTRIIGQINALDILGEELDQVFFNGKSIDEALKSAQQRGEQAIAEVRKN
ncbi:MAG: ABC transporter substrate-binding protein [Tissierellales bacterium]|jgi:multiple sugar transport system substrate-binding protein|nr:ABC transporter substrate-binding protein [Tissierellales bacterium]